MANHACFEKQIILFIFNNPFFLKTGKDLIKNLLRIYIVILLIYSGSAESRQLAVPGEFERIQLAIEQAEHGDSVIVAPGEYPETVDFTGKNILLLGNSEDPSTTIIDGGHEQRCVLFSRQENRSAILDGFTLRNGIAEYGSGILISSESSPTVRNCIINSNTASKGAGICVRQNSNPDISYCIINDNRANLVGGGICFIDSRGGSVSNCTITRNRAQLGGGIDARNTGISIDNVILWENHPSEIRSTEVEISVQYSDIMNGVNGIDGLVDWGDGNIPINPKFNNPEESDFSLNWESPCIDTGNPDLEDHDGTRSDMGALPVFLEPNPAILVSASDIDFGTVQVGDSSIITVSITNIGTEELEIIDIFIEGDYFSADFDEIDIIRSRQTERVEIIFSPEDMGENEGRIFINSNDPQNDEIDIWLTGEGVIPPSIYIEPLTVRVEVDSGEVEECVVNITNEGGSELIWRSYKEYIEPEFARDHDNPDRPRRLDAGDLIATYPVPYTTSYGMAWDGEHMWGIATDNNRLIEFDPESEDVISDYQIHIGPRALTFDGDYFWISSYNPSNNIYLYNKEGELVDRFEIQVRSISGLAYDGNSRIFVNSWDEQRIYVIDKNSHEVIADFDMLLDFRRNNYKISRLEWVPGHFDGHLWSIVGNTAIDVGFAVRVNVDGNWQARERQRFQLQHAGHTGVAHDGANLWHGGVHQNTLWHVYDDGMRDMRWLEIEPPQGTLQSEEDTDVIFILNSNGLDAGVYSSRVQIVSNAPDNNEIEIDVSIFVGDWFGISVEESNLPLYLSLQQNYPNPFNAETRIQFTTPVMDYVVVSIYDVNGNQICILREGLVQSGTHNIMWDAGNYPAGVYFSRLSTPKGSTTLKMLLVK